MVRKLYDWVLSWSASKWGWLALFFMALFEASWFPLPPDILLIALCIGATQRSFRFARTELHYFLRSEKKFENLDALKAQLQQDKEQTAKLFEEAGISLN